MNISIVQLVGILAASITVISTIVYLMKKLRKSIISTQNELDNIKTALNQQQRFVFNRKTTVFVFEKNKFINIDKGVIFIFKSLHSDGWLKGTVFYNEVEIIVSMKDLTLIEIQDEFIKNT